MLKRLLIGLFLAAIFSPFISCTKDKKTEVLVLGTIHQSHLMNPNYTLKDVISIMDSYQPEVICVEIRPKDFRKKNYLPEMTLASIYGISNEIPVYPIDRWTKGVREERRKYTKTKEFATKNKLEDSLRKANETIQNFVEKYGTWADYSKSSGYKWYNSPVFNEYVDEESKISMKVYGDHCMNLHYQSRNDSMVNNIYDAIEKNRGKKIMVLTGAEHKHYFDRALGNKTNIEIINFKNLNIQSRPIKNEAVKKYITFGDPSVYLGDISLDERFYHIRAGMVPLIHGMNMDFKPFIIPKENIEKCAEKLTLLEKEFGHLPDYKFEKGWVNFLEGNYKKAINYMDEVMEDSAEVHPKMKWFVLPAAKKTKGWCYDLLGKREFAIQSYKEGKKIAKKYGKLSERKSKMLYDKWIEKPYTHQKEEKD